MSQNHGGAHMFTNIEEGAKKIVLVGNPNVGKSIFFNALTGVYVDVSNFPGTTVDISYGKYKDDYVIDTPGVYGVSSFNDEEIVARDVILQADTVINIVNAVHLDRDLFLTQQIIDMGKPVIVMLNMMDEARKKGLEIDVENLSKLLKVPIIPAIAVKGEGINELKNKLLHATKGNRLTTCIERMKEYTDVVEHEAEALLILEDDQEILNRYALKPTGLQEKIYRERREFINDIIEKVVSVTKKGIDFKTKLSRWMLNPITGFPIMFVVLFILYKFIGEFIAQDVVGFTEEIVMGSYYLGFINKVFSGVISNQSIIGKFLIGEYGVITMVPVYIIGLLLPLVVGFYFVLSIIEDTGYLPRLAALVDSSLNKIGMNGKAIIPIILGFGCVTMATITTRILGSKRERIIATVLLGLTIPCSAQLGVIIGMLFKLESKYILIYLVTIVTVFVLVGTLLDKLLPGESSHLLIDLPMLRLPKFKNVFKKTYIKSIMFLKEAAPLFVIGAIIITFLEVTGLLNGIQDVFAPITVNLLKLPAEASNAFIMGVIRRDFGVAGLYDLALAQGQTLVALIVMTLFVPCIAAMLVIFKERTWKEATLIWVGSFVVAFLVGGVIAQFVL